MCVEGVLGMRGENWKEGKVYDDMGGGGGNSPSPLSIFTKYTRCIYKSYLGSVFWIDPRTLTDTVRCIGAITLIYRVFHHEQIFYRTLA